MWFVFLGAIIVLFFLVADQLSFRNIDNKLFIPPEGKVLESNFCVVNIVPQKSACFIVEKRLPYLDSYRLLEIKNSYKTNDLYGAFVDIFTPETDYEILKKLCDLYEVIYKEKVIIEEQKIPEVQEKQIPKEESENFTMPVIPVEVETDQEVETKYNDEREVDL